MLKKSTSNQNSQKSKNFIKGWHLMGLMYLKIDELIKQKKKTQKKLSRINMDIIEEAENSIVKQK